MSADSSIGIVVLESFKPKLLIFVSAVAPFPKRKWPKAANTVYAIHKPHLLRSGLYVYRGISGEQFHGSKAS
ncbi:hypothetical protein J2Y56_005127 [Pseudomonas sp. BE134]|nr:hypothetical protein [Pseudomonas sp. BE134]